LNLEFRDDNDFVLPADQTDLLRRELDSRFLDRAGLGAVPPAPPYLRQELHHHQHQHTHLHQHQHQSILPTAPPASAALFPPPLFKDIPKIGVGDSPFYRTGAMGMPAYPGYPPSLLHPGLGGPTQFVPPSHLPSFAPKVSVPAPPVGNHAKTIPIFSLAFLLTCFPFNFKPNLY
jgi:autism susceptibility gene 2 protein